MTEYDVAIVGGGFAGAVAARELTRAGRTVVVLEAKDRIGGRGYSTTFRGRTVELGGHWVHWLQPHVWAEITRYGAEVVETPGARAQELVYLTRGGRLLTLDAHGPARKVMRAVFRYGFDRFCRDAEQVFPRPYDAAMSPEQTALDRTTVRHHLESLRFMPPFVRDYVGGMMLSFAGELDQGSAAQIMRTYAAANWSARSLMDAGAKYQLRDGTGALVQAIMDDSSAEVRLGAYVREILDSGAGVELSCADGTKVDARYAVVTVPTPAYKQIAFTPALTPALQHISDTATAVRGVKIHALLDRQLPDFFAQGAVNQPFNWIFAEDVGPDGTLVIAGTHRHELVDVDDHASVEAALQRYIPGVRVIDYLTHNWVEDELAWGGGDGSKVGEMAHWLQHLHQPHGRVHFAGSGTATAWKRFIDGAIESGLRVSRELRGLLDETGSAAKTEKLTHA
ncbi:monoamine oxidase [Nocardioides thalensis]|uniref:Monoamine oxidase n=1 Tax=Nocardioides thalensis TaxID=1914755 RepID=A0A853C720_9ACTN|nr:monoamine oxidase [Nocardioides thalensis]